MAGCIDDAVMMQMNCNKYRQIPGLKDRTFTPAYKDRRRGLRDRSNQLECGLLR